jgi:hypothetical protein
MMIRHTTRLYFLIFSFFVLVGCSAHQPPKSDNVESSSSDVYSYHAPSLDGSGKIYMGREIARVMDPANASWLERPNRKVEELIKEMAAVGLRWQETKEFLPQQHFMVFERLINHR